MVFATKKDNGYQNRMDDYVFPVPPPEVESQKLPLKRTQEQSELPLPPSKRPTHVKKKSLLSGYAIQQISPVGRVDRTCFYDKFIFHKQDQTKDGPQIIELRPGMVVGLWQYGKAPMVIKALTNNKGTSVIWKAIVKKLDEENFTEECSEPTRIQQNPPDEEFSVQVSEIWYIYSSVIQEYADPQEAIREKSELIAARKRRNREKKKQEENNMVFLIELDLGFFYLKNINSGILSCTSFR